LASLQKFAFREYLGYNYNNYCNKEAEHNMNLSNTVLSSAEAAKVLGIHPLSIQKLIYSGALSAEKIANRWLIPREEFEEFAKTYNPNRGRPRTKRKYTKRSPIWQAT
jgi:excisionase family DNA binding protein